MLVDADGVDPVADDLDVRVKELESQALTAAYGNGWVRSVSGSKRRDHASANQCS